jgi:hypothetical protein
MDIFAPGRKKHIQIYVRAETKNNSNLCASANGKHPPNLVERGNELDESIEEDWNLVLSGM